MAAETQSLKFTIDDVEYDVPGIDEFDMDEWQIVYDYSGLILDDFLTLTPALAALGREVIAHSAEAAKLPDDSDERRKAEAALAEALERLEAATDALDDDVRAAEEARQRKLAQPAFTKALLHIAYRRAHPEVKSDAIGKLVGKANLIRVTSEIHDSQAAEEPAVPLASTLEPEQSSLKTSGDSSSSASKDSLMSSDGQDAHLATTGTPA